MRRKERPRRLNRLGRCLPVPVAQSRLLVGKDFEKIIFAVLLREEKSRPIFLEYLRPDQSVN